MGVAFSFGKMYIFRIPNHKYYKREGGRQQPKIAKPNYCFGDAPRGHQTVPRRPQDASKGPLGAPQGAPRRPKTGCMFWNVGFNFGAAIPEFFFNFFWNFFCKKNLDRKSKTKKNQKKTGVAQATPRNRPQAHRP